MAAQEDVVKGKSKRKTDSEVKESKRDNDKQANGSLFRKPYDYAKYPLGRVEPNLNKATVKIVDTTKNDEGFSNYRDAMDWAEKNLCKVYSDEETGGKGEFEIVPKVVGKYVSKVARDKSENEYYHYVVLRNLPSLIHDSIEVETHPNFLSHGAKKVDGDTRYDMNALVHILYGAVLIKDKICRVKITVKEYPSNMPSRPYTFEVASIDTDIEPSKPIGDEAQRLGRDFGNSISAAKLLKGVEKSYDPGKKLLDESKNLPKGETRFSLRSDESSDEEHWERGTDNFDDRVFDFGDISKHPTTEFSKGMAYRETDINELRDILESGVFRRIPEGKTVEFKPKTSNDGGVKKIRIMKMKGNSHGGKGFSKGAPWSIIGGSLASGGVQKVLIGVDGDLSQWKVGYHGNYSDYKDFSEIEHGSALFLPFNNNGDIEGIDAEGLKFWAKGKDGKFYEIEPNGGVKASKRANQSTERALRDALVERLQDAGIGVSMDEKEGQRVLDWANGGKETQHLLKSLSKAERIISNWIKNGKRGRTFTIELPMSTLRMVRNAMGRDFDSHNITANGIAHGMKNHGTNGNKLGANSIPLSDRDFSLAPYIMVSPDYVQKGSDDVSGRTSIRFYKTLSNGYVVVAEKEYKNSPDDMETITMWAEMSDKATNAQQNAAPDTHVRNAILDTDAAKIRKDAENTIRRDSKMRFFRGNNGEAYGFTVNGKIYIDPAKVNAETPIHEYAHLWATALQQGNAKEWQNVVSLMKGTKVWDEVRKGYPDLKTDDEIADEVLATYSGRRGADRLREEMARIRESNGDVFSKAEAIHMLERVKQAVKAFWRAVADFLHIRYTSAEQVADQVMGDLLNGVNPNVGVDADGKVREQFIGEKGAAAIDHAEEANTRMDNLRVARQMEEAKKDADAIKVATGWERGADGKWRYEVPDIRLKPVEEWVAKRKKFTLADIIEANDPILKMYPKLKDIAIKKNHSKTDAGGYYDKVENEIKLPFGLFKSIPKKEALKYFKSTVGHEIQHVIQDEEGFARGGSPKTLSPDMPEEARREFENECNEFARLANEYNSLSLSERNEERNRKLRAEAVSHRNRANAIAARYQLGMEGYNRLAGEVEARNVENRMDMTPFERMASLASETEDVAREDQIFLGVKDNGGVSEMGSKVNNRMAELRTYFENTEMTEIQSKVADVFSGVSPKASFTFRDESTTKSGILGNKDFPNIILLLSDHSKVLFPLKSVRVTSYIMVIMYQREMSKDPIDFL